MSAIGFLFPFVDECLSVAIETDRAYRLLRIEDAHNVPDRPSYSIADRTYAQHARACSRDWGQIHFSAVRRENCEEMDLI